MEILFLIACFQHEKPHFLFQALALTLVILAFLMIIPNLLINKIILSILPFIAFLSCSIIKYQPIYYEVFAVTSYTLLIILFGCISSYYIDKYQRSDFANKLHLIKLSATDPLTQIYNRQKFDEVFKEKLQMAKRCGNIFSLIMFDIDHFKKINDTGGHLFGDKILTDLAQFVNKSIRDADFLARWGGEEFIILLPETDSQDAFQLTEKLRLAICKTPFHNVFLTCSFGVTSYSPGDNLDSLITRVDNALYRAKKAGRNAAVGAIRKNGWIEFTKLDCL